MALTASTTASTVTVDGLQVSFADSGFVPGGQRPLVLVHGTGGTIASHFAHLFPMMATRTRVVGVDWSPLPDGIPLTLEALVRQVRSAADAALGENAEFDLLGYSLGAVVAARLAADLGSRVTSLILVAGWIKTDLQQTMRNQVWRSLYDHDQDALRRYTAFCGFSGPFFQQFTPEILEGALSTLSTSEFTRQQMELNAAIDITQQVGTITATTLIVSCKDDIMVPRHHQFQLLGAIDDARLTTVASGHAIFMERPAELMEITDLFLREPHRHPAGALIPETES